VCVGVSRVTQRTGPTAVYFGGEVDAGEYVALEPVDLFVDVVELGVHTVLEILVVSAVDLMHE
jgi:hypothetical protein